MTITADRPSVTTDRSPERVATRRRFLMCRPTYFAVAYAINPWMDPSQPVDVDRAIAQWDALRRLYLDLGHQVEEIAPEPGLPDMVFAANGGLVVDGTALGARFRHPQRRAEGDAYLRWFAETKFRTHAPAFDNEGEGDFLLAGDILLAGTGFRTDRRAHAEAAEVLARDVVSLDLVDPRFYHLDTALCVLDDRRDAPTVAYWPGAFSAASLAELRNRFPDAIVVSEADAEVFGLNAVSDGRHVVLSAQAEGFARQLRARGFSPVGVETGELRKAGGSAKCATLELRAG